MGVVMGVVRDCVRVKVSVSVNDMVRVSNMLGSR